jgi:hypothetical protein
MAPRKQDPHKLASPRVYLLRMTVFLVLTGFLAAMLSPQLYSAFSANPGLNGLIIGVLLIGIALAIRQGLTASTLKETIFAYPTGASDIGYML